MSEFWSSSAAWVGALGALAATTRASAGLAAVILRPSQASIPADFVTTVILFLNLPTTPTADKEIIFALRFLKTLFVTKTTTEVLECLPWRHSTITDIC